MLMIMIMRKPEWIVKKTIRKMRNIDNVNDNDFETVGINSVDEESEEEDEKY